MMEVLKGHDDVTALRRHRSFETMDALSQGATLVDEDDRVSVECARMLAKFSDAAGRADAEPTSWTKPALMLTSDALDTSLIELPPTAPRSYREFVWKLSLARISEVLPEMDLELSLDWTAAKLNSGEKAAEVELASFTRLLAGEIRGVVEVFAEPRLQAWITCLPAPFGTPEQLPDDIQRMFINALVMSDRGASPTTYSVPR